MSTYYVAGIPYSDELYHHGVKGQKLGVRRYQNEDGSLTDAGRRRYESAFSEATDAWHKKYEYGDIKERTREARSKTKNKINKLYDRNMREQKYDEKDSRAEQLLQQRRNKSMLSELFNTKSYRDVDKAYREADKARGDAYDKVIKNTLLETYDYVQKMPKQERAEAMAYVYERLGLHW